MRTHIYVAAIAMVAGCNLTHPADVFPDDTLVTLTASHGVLDPPFDPELDEYDLDLVLDEADLALTPTATVVDGTTMTLDGNPITSGSASPAIGLAIGETRDVHVVVTRGGGDVRTYVLHVHRGVDGLASLAPSKGALTPGFDPEVSGYAVGLHLEDGAAAVTATLLFPARAALSVNGANLTSGMPSGDVALTPGTNRVAVLVTPKTRMPRAYDVEVVRGIDAVGTINLSFAGAPLSNALDPPFDPAHSSYSVHVGPWLTAISLSATPFVPGSAVTVAGAPVPAGSESQPVLLNAGATSTQVVVTAKDGSKRIYVVTFERDGAPGSPQPMAPSDAYAQGKLLYYGSAMAIHEDTVVIGAQGDRSSAIGVDGSEADTSANASGAAFVFVRAPDGWHQQAYLKASNTGVSDYFGSAVGISGDTIAIGAPGEDSAATLVDGDQSDNSVVDSGAIYVFRRTGSTWAQEAYIKAPTAVESGYFGQTVALWGDTLVTTEIYPTPTILVYTRTGTTWSLQQSLEGLSTSGCLDGVSLSLWNDTLVQGSYSGVNVYERSGGHWSAPTVIQPAVVDPTTAFGCATAISGDRLYISQMPGYPSGKGTVLLYSRTGKTWSSSSDITFAPAHGDGGDFFGRSIAAWGDTVAIGAPGESSGAGGFDGDQTDNSVSASGAVYVFHLGEDVDGNPLWLFSNYVKETTAVQNHAFGYTTALWGDTSVMSSVRAQPGVTAAAIR